MNKELIQYTFKSILPYLIGFILCLILIANCKGCKHDPIISNNTLRDTVRVLTVRVDSMQVVRTKLVTKWRSIRDTINIHDTIQVITALNLCDTIILKDSVQISTMHRINDTYKKIVYNDSLVIDSLKTSKKKYFKGFKHGFITGASLGVVGGVLVR